MSEYLLHTFYWMSKTFIDSLLLTSDSVLQALLLGVSGKSKRHN